MMTDDVSTLLWEGLEPCPMAELAEGVRDLLDKMARFETAYAHDDSAMNDIRVARPFLRAAHHRLAASGWDCW
jgi:hypothetical protein